MTTQNSWLSPVFIVGAPRSGTTLVGKITGSNPSIHGIAESHFFEDIWTRRGQFGDLSTPENLDAALEALFSLYSRYNFPAVQAEVDQVIDREQLITDFQQGEQDYKHLYAIFMGMLATHAGKPRFSDDTPKHLFHLDTLFELYPDAKVIACVRDARDFLSSYKNYWKRSTESDRVRALYHPVITSLNWRSTARLIVSGLEKYGDRIYLLHYESLVTEPEQEVKKLCAFLGEPYSPEMITIESDNSSYGAQERGIFATSVSRWKSVLDPTEVWWIQRIAGKEMAQLDYRLESTDAPVLKLAGQLIASPFALLRALRANRHKRGALLPYLWKRLVAINR